jgi:regulator of PEP synthase PpsR (kinase-PPPase family)
MRATCAQFDNIMPVEHSYFLVRSIRQLERVLREIEAAPGVVMFTLSNLEHRALLERRCEELGMPCVAVLDPVLDVTSRYLGQELNHRVGAARRLNAEYFKRIDALDFAMDHDDGQQVVELSEADVILVGVSRTSKTPTSVYLAHRGVKAANVPMVPGVSLPPELFAEERPLVVGLLISADRLIHIRKNRLAAMKETRAGSYTDEDAVRREVMEAQKLFEREGWPTIDVSRRSIEETAAAVLNLLAEHRGT